MNCHCGAVLSFEKCCEPYILKESSPETAEQLMRSRYSAFAVGAVDYIYETHHPSKRSEVSKDEIMSWSQESTWNGLEVIESSAGQKKDEKGVVEFVARYSTNNQKYSHHEQASFQKIDGNWFFVDGKIIKNIMKNPNKHVGRNDPCICGSGKKYKKCCLIK
jgi:SEC-C motif domain protein